MAEDNVTQMKGPRTKESMIKSIQNEISDARLKQFKAELKKLIEKKTVAEKVVAGIDAEIDALAADYADVIPE